MHGGPSVKVSLVRNSYVGTNILPLCFQILPSNLQPVLFPDSHGRRWYWHLSLRGKQGVPSLVQDTVIDYCLHW